jgi:transposase
MTPNKSAIKLKLALLKLVNQTGNIAEACEIMGYSRDSYYRIKKLYEAGGEAALADLSHRKPNLRNRVADEIEQSVVELASRQPGWGTMRVANELKNRGLTISQAGVRCVWLRHDLETSPKRLKAATQNAQNLALADAETD